MDQLKILLIEDTASVLDTFKEAVKEFNDDNAGQVLVTFESADSVARALEIVNRSFDGAILDLKLGNDEDAGNSIIKTLNDSLFRIPIIFVTGYPKLVNDHPLILNIRSRDSAPYEKDIDFLWKIKNTGLTDIMGGKGIIETKLYEVFLRNLLPSIKPWIAYGQKDSQRTEKALLRHTVNHLFQLLDEDRDQFFAEEVYICPPMTADPKTGSIVKNKSDGTFFAVLNPACDLVIRESGSCKTDMILLVKIETAQPILDEAVGDATRPDKVKKKKEEVYRNIFTNYYHWLPKAVNFDGGILNFRKLKTLNKTEFDADFDKPAVQISPPFVKDIVARFASYYARQGQPDIDCD